MLIKDIKPRCLFIGEIYDDFAYQTEEVDFDVEDLVALVVTLTDVFYWINIESVWGKIGFEWTDIANGAGQFRTTTIPFTVVPVVPDGERLQTLTNLLNGLNNEELTLLASNWENIETVDGIFGQYTYTVSADFTGITNKVTDIVIYSDYRSQGEVTVIGDFDNLNTFQLYDLYSSTYNFKLYLKDAYNIPLKIYDDTNTMSGITHGVTLVYNDRRFNDSDTFDMRDHIKKVIIDNDPNKIFSLNRIDFYDSVDNATSELDTTTDAYILAPEFNSLDAYLNIAKMTDLSDGLYKLGNVKNLHLITNEHTYGIWPWLIYNLSPDQADHVSNLYTSVANWDIDNPDNIQVVNGLFPLNFDYTQVSALNNAAEPVGQDITPWMSKWYTEKSIYSGGNLFTLNTAQDLFRVYPGSYCANLVSGNTAQLEKWDKEVTIPDEITQIGYCVPYADLGRYFFFNPTISNGSNIKEVFVRTHPLSFNLDITQFPNINVLHYYTRTWSTVQSTLNIGDLTYNIFYLLVQSTGFSFKINGTGTINVIKPNIEKYSQTFFRWIKGTGGVEGGSNADGERYTVSDCTINITLTKQEIVESNAMITIWGNGYCYDTYGLSWRGMGWWFNMSSVPADADFLVFENDIEIIGTSTAEVMNAFANGFYISDSEAGSYTLTLPQSLYDLLTEENRNHIINDCKYEIEIKVN